MCHRSYISFIYNNSYTARLSTQCWWILGRSAVANNPWDHTKFRKSVAWKNVAFIESVNNKGDTPITYLLDNGVLAAIELLKPFNVDASKVDIATLIKRFGKKLSERNLRDLIELGSKAEGINTQLNSPESYAKEIERYDLASILHSEPLKEGM